MAKQQIVQNSEDKVSVTIRLKRSLLEQLEQTAKETFRTRSGLIVFILRYAMEDFKRIEE